MRHGSPVEIPVGSTAVRDAIERFAPTVGLHGHIHESQGVQRLGETVCLNPGSDYASGVLQGAIVDFDEEGGYVNHLFTSGCGGRRPKLRGSSRPRDTPASGASTPCTAIAGSCSPARTGATSTCSSTRSRCATRWRSRTG